MSRLRVLFVLLIITSLLSGCSRQRYRLRADRDAYSLLHEKTACAPWQDPSFRIDIAPDSRLAHRSRLDDPCLPDATPELYAYNMPEVMERDPNRFLGDSLISHNGAIGEAMAAIQGRTIFRLPFQPGMDAKSRDANEFRLATFEERQPRGQVRVAYLPLDEVPPEPTPAIPGSAAGGENLDGTATAATTPDSSVGGNTVQGVVPIDRQAWASIPRNCLVRTLEFSSVRDEYEQTYRTSPSKALDEDAPRLSLEDLLEIAVRDSREYQTQKELLYRAALRLSLERFDYQLKFSPTGNGTAVDWVHQNDAGITENSLGVASGAAVEKVLSTGGTILARFANDVVLTFNGPAGFATDVSSELFAEITQPLLQRDIVFERLTQAERDVVYAARDYARFRKRFFRDIASSYYRLLLTYRSIEIDMLDFFSNQRGFDRARSEYRLGQRLPRFQVDQFEQNALNSRSRVIRSCNQLEQSFDELKLRLGVPPETPINLDLTELEIITAGDEVTVAAELAQRAFRSLQFEVNQPGQSQFGETGPGEQTQADRAQTVNSAFQLAQKLQLLFELQAEQEDETESELVRSATQLTNKLQVEAAKIKVADNRRELRRALTAERAPSVIDLYPYRINLVQSLLEFGDLYAEAYNSGQNAKSARVAERYETLQQNVDLAYRQLDGAELLAAVEEYAKEAEILLQDVEQAVRAEEQLDASSLVRDSLLLAEELQTTNAGGLAPIDIDVDDAMLTALVTRFDLMNQRGVLADAWRQIKLTGDDLRSILNLRASQSIRTDPTNDNPFDFTFDESQTRLGLTFDAPLNRRAQRNAYRFALINYNLALRNLMQAEDEIKFAIRSDLRNLQLDREQYAIAVAGAALASDRRFSTRKQLDLNVQGITARDFLEAQTAYTASLNGVASAHIDYILDRIDLFLDLELLQVDEFAFWPDLYNESLQPEMRLQPPSGSGPAYGRLPAQVHYSRCMRRMDCIPFGPPRIYDSGNQSMQTPEQTPAAPLPGDPGLAPLSSEDSGAGILPPLPL